MGSRKSGADRAEELITRLERATARAREAEAALAERNREAHGLTKDLHAALREWRAELSRSVDAQVEGRCQAHVEALSASAQRAIDRSEAQIVSVFDKLIDQLVGARIGGVAGLERHTANLDSRGGIEAFAARFRARLPDPEGDHVGGDRAGRERGGSS